MWVFFLSFFSEACKYNKGEWLPCNEATNEKTRQLTLKKGDPNICNATMTIVKPCRRRDAFTAAKTSRRLISEFVNLRSRLAWHQNLCSGCFFTHVLYLCADSHLLHVISDYTLFFVEHKIETCVFAYKLLWKIKIAMYENLWLYTKKFKNRGLKLQSDKMEHVPMFRLYPLFACRQEVVDLPAMEITWLSVVSLLAPMLSCSGCGLCLVTECPYKPPG